MIAVYVSGHGFGHSTRIGEVLRAVRRLDPSCPIHVVTAAPATLYRHPELEGLQHRADECDVGLVQQGALVIDTRGTVERWRLFTAGWESRLDREADWLRSIGARLVLGDVPPLAFAAAARAGVASVALANFSWDWIFRHLARHEPALEDAASWAASGYAQAGELLRLPFYGDMPAFRTVVDVPLVARRPTRPRADSRQQLDLPSQPVVLFSFDGLGLRDFDARVLENLAGYFFITTDTLPNAASNARVLDSAALDRLGLSYSDVVAAADVVVTKPGYGIVSDCLGAGTRIVYTDRGDFPEYPILVEGMARFLPAAFVSHDQLRRGDIGTALAEVLRRPVPPPPDMSGAPVVARRLLDLQA